MTAVKRIAPLKKRFLTQLRCIVFAISLHPYEGFGEAKLD